MGVFFKPAQKPVVLRTTLRDALLEPPPTLRDADAKAEQLAEEVQRQLIPGRADLRSFLIAGGLLLLLIVLALLAERANMETATTNLWKAFEVILGVVVGFLGGEATGRADVGTES